MKTPGQAKRAREAIDRRFRDETARGLRDRPDEGWIRSVREAVGMTSGQLAHRMGMTQPAVSQLEQSELSGQAQLDSMRRAADALDCRFVYALVPRTTLENTMHKRAVILANRDLSGGETGDTVVLERRIDHYAARLVTTGRLWDERDAG